MVTNALGTSRWHLSPFMTEMSRTLEAANSQRAAAIRDGKLFSTGSIASNDAAFVHYEQSLVQTGLDAFKARDAKGYDEMVADANKALNGPIGDRNFARAINIAQQGVGDKLDFANQEHREALGRAAAQVVRSTAQYCLGSHIRTC